ncbi:MAG: FAD:protein FMN transferase [Saprospiraceae bacterium]
MKKLTFYMGIALLLAACNNEKKSPYLSVEGKTMGTYYKITYQDSLNRDFSAPIDSLLKAVNHEISTYEPNSTISQFNQADSVFDLGLNFESYSQCIEHPANCGQVVNRHFYTNLLAARAAHDRTDKAFDPTIMPLVNYWGFGYTPHKAVEKVDSLAVDSLIKYVGFEKMSTVDENGFAVLKKSSPGVQLDFGGTGQGYGIDIVAELLELKGIKNYLVDIGGESRARGKNPNGEWWTIGINTPKSDAEITDFTRVIQLQDMSVSTSGNYRNFHEMDGQKYSHFISPFTGFPEKSNLLSASVFGKDCLMPDALATGFMVLGLEKSFTLASSLEGIEALFIYSDGQGNLQVKYTPGVEKMFVTN